MQLYLQLNIDPCVVVIGCADVPMSSGTWVRRISSTEVLVGCTARSDSWRLVCENELWTGTLGNCSEGREQKLRINC